MHMHKPKSPPSSPEERLDLVSAVVSSVSLRRGLSDEHLRRVPDLTRIARRLARKQADLQDLYR